MRKALRRCWARVVPCRPVVEGAGPPRNSPGAGGRPAPPMRVGCDSDLFVPAGCPAGSQRSRFAWMEKPGAVGAHPGIPGLDWGGVRVREGLAAEPARPGDGLVLNLPTGQTCEGEPEGGPRPVAGASCGFISTVGRMMSGRGHDFGSPPCADHGVAFSRKAREE